MQSLSAIAEPLRRLICSVNTRWLAAFSAFFRCVPGELLLSSPSSEVNPAKSAISPK